jgi:cellular nucleic acid-binding protein
MARGSTMYAPMMMANPYNRPKENEPYYSFCELCERKLPNKDWSSHKQGKAHRAAEQKEREELEKAKNAGSGGSATAWGVDDEFSNANNKFGSGDAFGTTTTGDEGWGSSGGFATTNTSSYNNNGGSGGDRACFGCGQTGHQKRDCPSGGGSGGNACYGCGETGHQKRDCPKGSGGQACYNCGMPG